MKSMLIDEFQYTVADLIFRNKSILDGLTKFQDSCSRVNRSIVKSVTQCGCCSISTHTQSKKKAGGLEELKNSLESHFEGKLCDECRDAVEKEFGKTLFYIASLCNTLDLNLYDIMLKELERAELLGKYNLR